MMNLDNLIKELEYMRDMHGGDTEVRLAFQPSWPFEHSVGRIADVEIEIPKDDDYKTVVYIAEDSQLGYLPEAVSETLEWS